MLSNALNFSQNENYYFTFSHVTANKTGFHAELLPAKQARLLWPDVAGTQEKRIANCLASFVMLWFHSFC